MDESDSQHSSEMNEEAMQAMEATSKPQSTARATVYGVNRFYDWLTRRNKTCDFNNVTAEQLNELLRKFYDDRASTVDYMNTNNISTHSRTQCAMQNLMTNATFNNCTINLQMPQQ